MLVVIILYDWGNGDKAKKPKNKPVQFLAIIFSNADTCLYFLGFLFKLLDLSFLSLKIAFIFSSLNLLCCILGNLFSSFFQFINSLHSLTYCLTQLLSCKFQWFFFIFSQVFELVLLCSWLLLIASWSLFLFRHFKIVLKCLLYNISYFIYDNSNMWSP